MDFGYKNSKFKVTVPTNVFLGSDSRIDWANFNVNSTLIRFLYGFWVVTWVLPIDWNAVYIDG